MRPTRTSYKLAHGPQDYKDCRELFCENHGAPPVNHLSWPTVVARRDGAIIGFLSTHPRKDVIMAGPLEVKGGRNPILFMRLIEAYESALRAMGISRFMFYTKADREDSFSPEEVEEYKDFGVKFLRFDHGQALFLKEVQNGRR